MIGEIGEYIHNENGNRKKLSNDLSLHVLKILSIPKNWVHYIMSIISSHDKQMLLVWYKLPGVLGKVWDRPCYSKSLITIMLLLKEFQKILVL